MTIRTEINDLYYFPAWSGACHTKDRIIAAGKGEAFMSALAELFPDGATDTQINNLLWFEPKFCLELVGISEEEED